MSTATNSPSFWTKLKEGLKHMDDDPMLTTMINNHKRVSKLQNDVADLTARIEQLESDSEQMPAGVGSAAS